MNRTFPCILIEYRMDPKLRSDLIAVLRRHFAHGKTVSKDLDLREKMRAALQQKLREIPVGTPAWKFLAGEIS